MKLADKKKFIRSLCNNIRDELLRKAASMPENWDGIELRQIIGEKAAHEMAPRILTGKRKRAYRAEIYQRNL